MNNQGQVSLESLLIWAALAGALVLFTPAFSNLMQAYALQEQVLELKSHAQQLESIFQSLSFQAPGSRHIYQLNARAENHFSVSAEGLELQLVHLSMASPKIFIAKSPIPISISLNPLFSSLIITRAENGITIQSQ